MRSVIAMLALTSGCSWILQDHLQKEYSGRSEPVCSTSDGLAGLDFAFAALNVLAAAIAGSSPGNNADAVIGGIADAALYVASAATGAGWASDCTDARAKWERDNFQGPALTSAERAESRELQRTLNRGTAPALERGVHEGSHPLYCKLSDDPTVGDCFSNRSDCDAAPRHSGDCVERTAGACFNADVVLDKTRIAICAPSISDCEKKLAAAKANPDYVVKAEQCGIYRVKARIEPIAVPLPQAPGSELGDPER